MNTYNKKKLVVRDTKVYGMGVFATRLIKKGSVIHTLSGKPLNLSEVIDRILIGKELKNDPLQIGRRTYLDLNELSRSFNHSCNPNAGIRKRSELFALRDILEREEICYDYSTTIAPTEWSMECKCGAYNCRKVLHDVRSIPKKQVTEYTRLGAFQKYMKPLLETIKSKTYKLPTYEINALKRLETNHHV